SFLRGGCGFGGSCLPKDVKALIAHGQASGQSMRLLEAIIRVNEEQPLQVIGLLQKHWPNLKGKRVAVLGLAFKPGTSDVRESPAFPILRELLNQGATVKAHDPVAIPEAQRAFPDSGVTYCQSLETALAEIDAVVVVTPWSDYGDLPVRLKGRQVVLVDGRRTFDKNSIAHYEGIGL